MKTLISIIIATAIGLSVYAQKSAQDTSKGKEKSKEEIKTIFGSGKVTGAYGAVSYGYTQVGSRDAFVNGGRGALIFNRNFAFGGGGYGIITTAHEDNKLSNNRYGFGGGYGGILLEPIFGTRKPMHIAVPVLIGAGGISYNRRNSDLSDDNSWQKSVDNSAYFVVEPGLELEFNLLRFLRISFGAYYRYTSDIKLTYDDGSTILPKDALRGASGILTLKFGKF